MKNKELEKLKNKYFDGRSSLEEEKELKKSNEAFFQLLNEEKNVKMDWSFDDFESQVTKDKKVMLWWNPTWLKYATAAVLLMIVGISFYMNQKSDINVPVLAHKKISGNQRSDIKDFKEQDIVGTISDSKKIDQRKESQVAMLTERSSEQFGHRRQTKTRDWGQKKKAITQSLQHMEDDVYQADYVILNGKPVTNEEEAVELTLKSLGLLANNLDNGVDKAMNIKQMSITIN